MKKTLLFAAVLLVPNLAYSANPSADLSIQVVPPSPNGIACDIGPSYNGSIPAAAAQAGFTHCAANYDFTQAQSFTDSHGTHQWSNSATWLDCNNNSAMASPILFVFVSGGVGCDSAHIKVVNDGGTQALALSYYLTDAQAGRYYNVINTGNFVGPPPGITGENFGEEFYMEQVIRVSSYNMCSASCLVWATSTYAPNYNINNPCFVSYDFDEFGGQAPGAANGGMHLWNPTCGTGGASFGPQFGNLPPSASTSVYNTYGVLGTADNVSQFAACGYWRNSPVNGLTSADFRACVPYTVVPPTTAPVFNAQQMLQLSEGPQSTDQGGLVWTGTSHTTYVQRVTMWRCPSPDSNNQCYSNPVITTHP